jgi:hypothetical protein
VVPVAPTAVEQAAARAVPGRTAVAGAQVPAQQHPAAEDPPAQVQAAAVQGQAVAGRAQVEDPQAWVDLVRPHPQQAPVELAQQVSAVRG